MVHAGIARRVRKPTGKLTASVLLAGQTATHSKHPVHSAERICTSLSTGRVDGHALAHLAQSIQVPRLRVIRAGLNREAQRLRVLAIATADELLVRGLRSFLGIYEKKGDGLDGILDRPLDIIRHQDS